MVLLLAVFPIWKGPQSESNPPADFINTLRGGQPSMLLDYVIKSSQSEPVKCRLK